MICLNCGKENLDEAIICPKCGCATGTKEIPKDKPSKMFMAMSLILSLFVPYGAFFGFILWGAKRELQPVSAKAYGLCAIIPWFIKWIQRIVIVCLLVLAVIIAAVVVYVLHVNGIIDLSLIMEAINNAMQGM
ncbi:MAG: zinc ribbon domain-containing protein [Clostridia bacterium]|nr:zinc ribbon domain-containing protein [Clostridia bacterium]